MKEEIFYSEDGKTLEQLAQRGGRCHIPGSVQGQVGQDSEQCGPVEDACAHCKGIGLDYLQKPCQCKLACDSMSLWIFYSMILCFCDSVILYYSECQKDEGKVHAINRLLQLVHILRIQYFLRNTGPVPNFQTSYFHKQILIILFSRIF